jgi:alpha-beta hydrolase superfamily lysophospholipase
MKPNLEARRLQAARGGASPPQTTGARSAVSPTQPLPEKDSILIRAAHALPDFAQLLFRGYDGEPPKAQSRTFQVQSPAGRTLRLRQWLTPDGSEPAPSKAGQPAILMVHGLGGTTEWLAPFATKLLEQNGSVYGLDIPRIGLNPEKVGDFHHRSDLLGEIRDAIEHLSKEQNRPVVAIGLSLGGLLVTHTAANPPKGLGGIVVISPAYKAASATFKPMIYVKAILRRMLEKIRLLKPGTIPIPFADDQSAITRNPDKIRLMRETEERITRLSTRACIELIKLTLLDTPKAVKQINVPLALFVAQHDKICDPTAMMKAFEQFPSPEKKLFVFPEAMHDLTLDPEMPAMADAINAWVSQHSGSPAQKPAPSPEQQPVQ